MKKKGLNAKRSKPRRKADSTTSPEQGVSQKTTPRTAGSGPPQTAPSAQMGPPQETGAPQESPEQSEPLEHSDTDDTAAEEEARSDDGSETAEDLDFDEAVVEHVQLLANLIDGQDLSREETIQMLRRIVRQHSIATETGLDYAVRKVKEKPP